MLPTLDKSPRQEIDVKMFVWTIVYEVCVSWITLCWQRRDYPVNLEWWGRLSWRCGSVFVAVADSGKFQLDRPCSRSSGGRQRAWSMEHSAWSIYRLPPPSTRLKWRQSGYKLLAPRLPLRIIVEGVANPQKARVPGLKRGSTRSGSGPVARDGAIKRIKWWRFLPDAVIFEC